MDFPLWKQLVNEAVYWNQYTDSDMFDLYQRTAIHWGTGSEYYAQGAGQSVDLTKIFEQYKLLATLKGTHHGSQINSENC